MRRALIALVLAPLLVSGVFGIFALIAFPFMLLMAFAVALPLLFFFRRMGRLAWWHAVLSGAICAVCFIAFNALMTALTGIRPDIDQLVDSNNVAFIRLGMLTAFVFWWMGVFRNAAFPYVDRRFPVTVVLVVPLAVIFVYLNHSLRQTYHQGRVIDIVVTPTANPRSGQASVQLTGGGVIQADLSNTWPTSMIRKRCVHLEDRWSTLRFRRVYQVDGPFGGGVDDC
jgi:hypothetical protein